MTGVQTCALPIYELEKGRQKIEDAMAAAKRGYVDSIIEAEDTRKYVIGAFEMLFTKREDRPSKKHGTE